MSTDPAHAADVARGASGWRRSSRPRGRSRSARSRRPAIPSSTASGSARRARSPPWSTATTTCSRPIRSTVAQPPFDPTVRDGTLYARGVSDDKGPMLIPIKVARGVLRGRRARCPLNVKFMFEGEEEIGSRISTPFIGDHTELLAADFGALRRRRHVAHRRAVAHGVEPWTGGLELTLTGGAKDLHSGRHGGGVANPLHAMARLIASLHDPTAASPSRGFYDEVRELSPPNATPSPRSRSTSRRTSRRSARPPRSASRDTRRSSGSGRGRRWRSTGCGAATRGRDRRP